ncbi:hypothetical protein [Paracoccus everestensis]|uniref:hypothetical protein n=1 Tax=Paracoccus everestensis TaxID=2903900 RepID=UPI001F26FAD3|nr:hypothetical protein [Paracoccus everestensis]
MRTEEELKAALDEHIGFLQSSCEAFDKGVLAEGKRIANSIYTLIWDYKRTKSILSQIGAKENMLFLSSGDKLDKDEILAQKAGSYASPRLLMFGFNERGITWEPRLGAVPSVHSWLSFKDWWEDEPIFWAAEAEGSINRIFVSRRELITSLTDQEGGRHLDPILDSEGYKLMKFDEGWRDASTNEVVLRDQALFMARQIGWEMLQTLERQFTK